MLEAQAPRYVPILHQHEDCYFYRGKPWSAEWLEVLDMPQPLLEAHLEAGFYVQGDRLYRPACTDCQDCIPMRLDVNKVHFSKSQRRLWRNNQDIRVVRRVPHLSIEKAEIYQRYHSQRWDWPVDELEDILPHIARHLYGGWPGAVELEYHIDENLLGFGILDCGPTGANSRYFVYDPQQPRSDGLGNYSLMVEIELLKAAGLQYLYLGMYVPRHVTMLYKVAFRPFELKLPDKGWTEFTHPDQLEWENGKYSENIEPSPSSLVAESEPPCSSASC